MERILELCTRICHPTLEFYTAASRTHWGFIIFPILPFTVSLQLLLTALILYSCTPCDNLVIPPTSQYFKCLKMMIWSCRSVSSFPEYSRFLYLLLLWHRYLLSFPIWLLFLYDSWVDVVLQAQPHCPLPRQSG